ncbi:glycosyltransferase [Pontibacter sp. JH31]|uniref:Glycosyltransferase n=1 Tax=Pontibacter aquaedesilientis TaxID=2766980 RepID=A0ABR7XF85_9BACT|nr:glycosyltransferase [Pontibacter aquaedesilientis]MBD1396955.1 glycosyltransferase [Pontibacter aquaedesilientis]
MKILRVTTELNYGGIEKVFELHAKYHDKSYDLVFVALGNGGNTEVLLQKLGYKVIVLNAIKVTIPSLKLISALTKVIKEENPDVVHAAGAEANFHATLAAKISGVKKIICEEIGIPSHSIKAKLFFRLIYSFSDKVIAISKAVETYLVESKESPANKVVLIYNPVNEFVKVEEVKKEEFLITIVARLEPVKNIDLLIEAFAELIKRFPKAKLSIIGNGSLRNVLQKQAERLHMDENISFKGYLVDPYPELLKSTFFVLPSLFEGFGLACIEAIQTENIVICTDSGGIPEFVSDGEHGFLFNPTSKEALLEKLEKAILLPETEKARMINSAQVKVKQMFSPAKYLSQLQELYQLT